MKKFLTAVALAALAPICAAHAQFRTADAEAAAQSISSGPLQILAEQDGTIAFVGRSPSVGPFTLAFQRCTGSGRNAACQAVVIFSYIESSGRPVSLDAMNAFAAQQGAIQSFVDRDGDIRMDYWLVSDGPFSGANLREAVKFWGFNFAGMRQFLSGQGLIAAVDAPADAEASVTLASEIAANDLNAVERAPFGGALGEKMRVKLDALRARSIDAE